MIGFLPAPGVFLFRLADLPHFCPVDHPSVPGDGAPDQAAQWSAAATVVQNRGPFVESAGMVGIGESKPMDVQVVAELMAQRAEKCAG